MTETLPGCIGYYGFPTPPNDCRKCEVSEACIRVVAKGRLQVLLQKVVEAKAILRGA